MVLSLLLSLTSCDNSKASNTPVPSTTSEVKQQQKLLSYDQYINLITATKENMKFSAIPMQLTESSIDNPSIVIVNGAMSFGKRKYLTLKDDFKTLRSTF